jgi:hypothetical protein
MGWIAEKCGVSKASAFNIVHAKMGADPDFLLMRYLVVNLGKDGADVPSYAHAIRTNRLFDEYRIDPETGERMISDLLATCFKLKWAPSAAIRALNAYDSNKKPFQLNILEEYDSRMQTQERIKKYQDLVNKERLKLGTFSSLRNRLEMANMEVASYRRKYNELLKRSAGEGSVTTINKKGLENLNKIIGYGTINEQKFLEKLDEIKRNPEKYWFLFDDDIVEIKSSSKPFQPSPLENASNIGQDNGINN